MEKVDIDLLQHGDKHKIIIVCDNESVLLQSKKVSFNLKRVASILEIEKGVDKTNIVIDGGNNVFDALNQIKNLLDTYSILYDYTDSTTELANEYVNDKEKFVEFSKKAKAIRNNDCDATDFEKFTNELHKSLTRTLYPLQLLSAYHLAFAQNACNFSVPGAGKTSIVYGAFAYLNSLPKDHPRYVNRILVIGPISSFKPWEDEYEACFGKKVASVRYSGNDLSIERKREFLYSSNPTLLHLFYYQAVGLLLDDLVSFLKNKINKVMIVLDEAHKIKNTEGGIWAESILKLSEYGSSRVILTGTPTPQGYHDLYNLYKFIRPFDYKSILNISLGGLKDLTKNGGDNRVNQLVDNIAPYFIRIKKSDLDLPPIIENELVYVEMDEKQRAIYDYIEGKYVSSFLRKQKGFKSQMDKAKLIRLRQASTDISLLKKPLEDYYHEAGLSDDMMLDDEKLLKDIRAYNETIIPNKFIVTADLAMKIIGLGSNEKVIIWTIFVNNAVKLKKYLESKGIISNLLIGKSNDEALDQDEKEQVIEKFNDPKNTEFNVVIANPFTVAESISLHKGCHSAIYMERDYNVANYIQSKDRIHRVSTSNKGVIVNYYYIVSKNSVDESVHDRLIEKEERMKKVIDNDIPLINLNMDYDEDHTDDIKSLIRLYEQRNK